MACRLVCDRDRERTFRWIRRFVGDRTSLSEVGLPGGRALVSSLTLGRGTSLHGLQASQPFPLVRVIKVRRAAPRELHRAHGEEEDLGVVGPEGV